MTVTGEANVSIRAGAEQVWAMVADVTRMGEWSPETERAEWIDGATGPDGQRLPNDIEPLVLGQRLPGQHGDPATGLQRPADVDEGGERIGEEHRSEAADGDVESGFLERMHPGVDLLEAALVRPCASLRRRAYSSILDDRSTPSTCPGAASRAASLVDLPVPHPISGLFAEHGSKQDLLDTIGSARDWAEQRAASGADISRGYLNGEGLFPERLPWLILTGQFLQEFNDAVSRWAEAAETVVEQWPEDLRSAEPEWATLENMVVQSETNLREAAARRRAPSGPTKGTGAGF